MRGQYWLFRWASSKAWKNFITSLLTYFGGVTLILEISNGLFPDIGALLKNYRWELLLLGGVYVLYTSWPRNTFSHKLSGRDTVIEISVKDAFKIKGALVVPSNTRFDTNLNGITLKASSIEGQLLRQFYDGNTSYLDIAIKQELSKDIYQAEKIETENEEKPSYKVGTTLKLEKDHRNFYVLALTGLNEFGRAEGRDEDLRTALAKLWYWISRQGDKGTIVIPLLGTGHARIKKSREDVMKEIIASFIASCADKTYCDKLVIALHPKDVVQYQIDLGETNRFLHYSSTYTNFDTNGLPAKGIGIS